MIIIAANGQSVTVAFDTIQAKSLMHIIRYVLQDPSAGAESYASRQMVESGLAITPMDLMMIVGQIAVTMGRVLTEAEVATLKAAEETAAQADKLPEDEKKEEKDKRKTDDGEWKH